MRAGQVYVLFGRTSAFPAAFGLARLLPGNGGGGSEGFVATGVAQDDSAGIAISGIGDMNGDGLGEMLIAASGAGTDGEIYVLLGHGEGFAPVVELADLFPAHGDGSQGFVLQADDVNDLNRVSVSEAGDVNDDGLADALIGGEHADTPRALAGRSYVVYGRSDGFPAVLALAALLPNGGGDGSAGFVLDGILANENSGDALSMAGDVNEDGIDDLFIGAYDAEVDFGSSRGEGYVVYGSANGFAPVFELGTLLPLAFKVAGECPGIMELEIQGLTRGRPFAVLAADAPGASPVPGGQCAGVPTALAAFELVTVRRTPDNGAVEWIEDLPQPVPICGKHLQVLDVASGELTNVVLAP
jgi:hypothetical protein